MRLSRRMTMLAAALVALLAGAPGTGLGQQADLWARIDGARIEIQPGATVEVCGSGHLAFVDGRRTIEALPGAAIRVAEGTGKVVRGDVAIEIRGPGSHRWVVRRAPGLPAAGGTTIRDPDDGGRASIDAAEPTRFWLAVGEGDETVFFQPEEDAAACDEAATTGGHPDSAAAAIDRTLDRLAGYGFSGAVLVARGGEPILAAGYGLADRERGIPVRPQTIFELGSLTKQFTATAVLLLAERGELSLDDSLGATWDLPPPVAEIKLHQLLTHTSGLPEDFSDPAPSSPAAVVDRLRGIELAAEPGTEFDLIWSALTKGHGPLAGYEVLGTAPDRAGRRITFVRLAFPDGEETLRLVWRPHLDGWGTGGTRPQREFRPVGPAEFATYDLFAGTTIRIRFHAEDGRRAIEFLDAPRAPRAVSR